MQRKLREYFEAGVRLVWFVDPRARLATVYTSLEQSTKVDSTGELTGGEVLRGFTIKLAELFADLPE